MRTRAHPQIDLKKNSKFLKRCVYPSVKLENLYVGSTVTVYSRQLHVKDFADEFTRRALGQAQEKCVHPVLTGLAAPRPLPVLARDGALR